MLFPTLDEVRSLAAQYRTVPVSFTFPADHRTPISIFTALSQGEETAFLLESVNNGTQWDRYSFIGARPRTEYRANGATLPSGAARCQYLAQARGDAVFHRRSDRLFWL